MAQRVYTTKRRTIINQSVGTWLLVLAQIVINIYILATRQPADWVVGIVLMNIFFGVNIPSVLLFFNYYKHSAGKQLTITEKYLALKDINTQTTTGIDIDEIIKIEHIESFTGHRLPWQELEFFRFTDVHNNRIVVTCFMMGNEKLLRGAIARKGTINKLIVRKKLFPFIRNY